MAKLPKIKNISTIQKNFNDNLLARANINNLNSDSITRSLFLPLVAEIERMNVENRELFEGLQIETARGTDLDKIARSFGLNRTPPAFSEVKPEEFNFIFYTTTTFGTINSGLDILIPKGTTVKNTKAARENAVIYETTQDVILSANSRKGYCPVRAINIGQSHNVNKHSLTRHNFTNYSDNSRGTLKCTNSFAILNGSNLESDSSLRYRINKFYGTITYDSEQCLMLKGLEVPGVTSVKVFPNYYGIGTVGIFVFGAGNKSSASLAQQVNVKLNERKPPGTKYYVTQGITVYLDLEITVYLTRELDSDDQNRLVRGAKTAVANYMSNYQGISLSLIDLRNAILNSSSDIVGSIDAEGRSNIFDGVYVRKSYGEGGMTSERVKIEINNVTISNEEAFTLGTLELKFEVKR